MKRRSYPYVVIKPRASFTLLELLVVIGIIAILAAVGIASYSKAQSNARDVRRKADLTSVQKALELYHLDHGNYPVVAQGINCSFCINDYHDNGSQCGGTRLSVELAPYLPEYPHDPQFSATACGPYTQNYLYTCGSTGCSDGQAYRVWAKMENPKNANVLNFSVGGRLPQDYYVIKNE